MSCSQARLSELEVSAGAALGHNRAAAPLPEVDSALHPVAALEQALLPALLRPPCLVSFSGGRDSSAALAVATRVARREGLAPPIPATLRFPGIESAEETSWQELVIRTLDLPDWHHRPIGSELELLGPLSRGLMARHGLVFPANAHAFAPLLEEAAPGSLVTGLDGDELFGAWRWARLAAALRGRVRPQSRDLARLGVALSPRPLRRRVMSARMPWRARWLTPAGQAAATDAWTRQREDEPQRWDRWVPWYARLRQLSVAAATWDAMAREAGAQFLHLFLDPAFLASMALAGGAAGFGDRTEATRLLFGDLLPDAVLNRSTKATFSHAFWGERVRAFAQRWDGDGLDPVLVDREALRREWLAPEPDFRSALALQAAWLGSSQPQ